MVVESHVFEVIAFKRKKLMAIIFKKLLLIEIY